MALQKKTISQLLTKRTKTIEFIRSKDFLFIKNLGQGGTGKTVLLKDEIMDETFVCKKYSPLYDSDKEKYFTYFKNEIKILYTLNHRNIVRIFNYYLYPEYVTGYILMEYVKGNKIDEYIKRNPEYLNEIFSQIIDGFCHLEKNKILHRDIRPDNILITEDGIVKIIDFGFGKNFEVLDDFGNSISLNWRYPIPNEFSEKIYDVKTDIYFLGKLFEEILLESSYTNFKFSEVINKMINKDFNTRIGSFFDISRMVLSISTLDSNISEEDKVTYRCFAEALSNLITNIEISTEYIKDPDDITMNLEKVFMFSMLEENVQNRRSIPDCFLKGAYSYKTNSLFSVEYLEAFLKLFKSSSEDKKKILLNNLWQRFDAISRFEENVDDLPF